MNRKLLFFLVCLLSCLLAFSGCGEKEPYETFERESRRPRPSTEESSAPASPQASTELPAPSGTDVPAVPTETSSSEARPWIESYSYGGLFYTESYDALGRMTERIVRLENGQLKQENRYQYDGDTDVRVAEIYSEYAADGSVSYHYEYELYPNGRTKAAYEVYSDGQAALSLYDEKGNDTGYTTWAANGQKLSESSRVYDEENRLLSSVSDSWNADGTLSEHTESSFYPNGGTRSTDRLYGDGSRWITEFAENGLYTREEKYYPNGQISSKHTREYGEQDVILRQTDGEWEEDGTLKSRGEYTYRADGTNETARYTPTWAQDTEYYEEYDEANRKTVSNWKKSDGSFASSVIEYEGDSEKPSRRTSTMTNSEGTSGEEILYYPDGSDKEHFWTLPDGSRSHTKNDESGRRTLEEQYDAGGNLLYFEEKEYFSDSAWQTSHTLEKRYDDYYEGIVVRESWYNENGINTKYDILWPDGSRNYSESNDNNNLVYSKSWYPNGVPHEQYEYTYYESNGWRASVKTTQWNEDGSEYSYSEEYSYENGSAKSYYYRSEGNESYYEYAEKGGGQVLETRKTAGVLVSRNRFEYSEDGSTLLAETRERWSEDGSFERRTEITYYLSGKKNSFHEFYSDGSALYREYNENEELTREETVNSEGNTDDLWVRNEDGSSTRKTVYSNGQLAEHYEWNAAGDLLLFESFTQEGRRVNYEATLEDGTIDRRSYDGNGLLLYQDLYTPEIYYDRRFSEGRMFLERRSKNDGSGVYLGSTEYDYYEEGGVKKIRISENDQNGTMIDQKIVNDDGTTGYIPEP